MTARDKFRKGGPVIGSYTGLRGTVVGFTNVPHHVEVVKEGADDPRVYHMDFWEPDSSHVHDRALVHPDGWTDCFQCYVNERLMEAKR